MKDFVSSSDSGSTPTDVKVLENASQQSDSGTQCFPWRREQLSKKRVAAVPGSLLGDEAARCSTGSQQQWIPIYPPALPETVTDDHVRLDTDAPFLLADDLDLELIEQILEGLVGYDKLGHMDIDHWPAKDERLVSCYSTTFILWPTIRCLTVTAQPAPPRFLTEAIQILREKYPQASIDGIMYPCQINIDTIVVTAERLEPGASAPAGYKLKLLPRIRCADCPGRLYEANPMSVVENFTPHMRNRLHRYGVELRLLADSETTIETIINIIRAVTLADLSQVVTAFAKENLELLTSREHDDLYWWSVRSSLLIQAIKLDVIDVLRYLLEQGMLVDTALDSSDRSAMHWACYLNRSDMATLLVDYNASLRHLDARDLTPLDLAVREGYVSTAVSIVEHQARKDGREPLELACIYGQLEIIQAILERGDSSDLHHSLEKAVGWAPVQAVRLLLEAGASVHLLSGGCLLNLTTASECQLSNRGLGSTDRRTMRAIKGSIFNEAPEKLLLLYKFGLDPQRVDDLSASSDCDSL